MRTRARHAVAGVTERLAGLLRADFADPCSIAALRSRIFVMACGIALPVTLANLVTQGAAWFAWPLAGPASMVFLSCAGAFTWRRGPRLGDGAFAVVLYLGYPVASTAFLAYGPTVALLMTAISSMIINLFAVLFLERTRFTWLGIGISVAAITSVAVAQPHGKETVPLYVTSLVAVLLTGVPTRLVRDLATSALVRSRQAEVTDTLTGLLNRRGLERSAATAWHEAARLERPVAALLLDVDHFKRINDEQGHAAGDDVLRRLGDLISRNVRAEDVAVRLGGEEFLVLCPCPPDDVRIIAERLRRVVEAEMTPVTVSIGVHTVPATAEGIPPEEIWSVVDLADQALYRAKAEGRNRVVIHDARHRAAAAAASHPPVPQQRLTRQSIRSPSASAFPSA